MSASAEQPTTGETKSDAWDRYDRLTRQASESTRAMALAGIAAVWLVTVGTQGAPSLLTTAPGWFTTAALAFALCIAFDICHYAIGGWVLAGWLREPNQKRLALTQAIPDLPQKVKGPTQVFYWAKISSLFVGYILFALGVALNFL